MTLKTKLRFIIYASLMRRKERNYWLRLCREATSGNMTLGMLR